jgi:hypothetical protein
MASVKMLLNLGELDQVRYSLPPIEDCTEGDVVEVDERQERIMVEMLKIAEPADKVRRSRAKSEEEKESAKGDTSAQAAGESAPSPGPQGSSTKGPNLRTGRG